MKYAVDRSLDGKKYETADIGESLARVMKYWTVRGKFEVQEVKGPDDSQEETTHAN